MRYAQVLSLSLLVLVATAILTACAVPAQGLVAQPAAVAESRGAESTNTGGFDDMVVSTEWVAQRLEDPHVRVIEVSIVPGLYEKGHVPGAVKFIWHTDFVDPVRRDVVAPERFQQLVRAAGINNETTVVLYGDNNNWFAAWGAWIFTMYGLEDVRLMDGGRTKWEAEGRAYSLTTPSPGGGNFTVNEAKTGLRARLADVREIVEGQRDAVLLDIRSPAEFSGELFAPEGSPELAVRAGHIPGAQNVPWSKAVNEDGTFKAVEELRALYTEVGVDGSKPVVVYCRIGERASHTWFVLSEILGYEVALYDGSWTEWGNSVGVPIENPAGTVWGGQ